MTHTKHRKRRERADREAADQQLIDVRVGGPDDVWWKAPGHPWMVGRMIGRTGRAG